MAIVTSVFAWALVAGTSRTEAQLYFTGPYGEGGTWNLYEFRGFPGAPRFSDSGEGKTWIEAHEDAIDRVEPLSGTNANGHLVAFSGPRAQEENDFINSLIGVEPVWIGLTDSEAFGGGEAGTDGMAGFGHPPGNGIGWKWTSGEVFDFTNWGTNQPQAGGPSHDAAWMYKCIAGRWEIVADGSEPFALSRPSIIEFETRAVSPLIAPQLAPPDFLGSLLPARPGAFAIREVAVNGPVNGLNSALRSLMDIGQDAVVRDYHAAVIDHQAETSGALQRSVNRPFEVHQRGDVSFGGLDHFAMAAHARVLVPEGQGGEWTFGVSSDDGFELYISGARFEAAFSRRTSEQAQVTPYGSLTFPVTRPQSVSLGHVTLDPGVHDLELIYYEATGFASVQLFAAPGRKTEFDASFVLVGAPAITSIGARPRIQSPFQIRQVKRTPNEPGQPTPEEQIRSLQEAKQLLASPGPNDTVVNTTESTFSRKSIAGAGTFGRFSGNSSFSLTGDDFAARATASLVISTPGEYTFGFSVLDGAELTITGAQFTNAYGEGLITNGGQSLTLDFQVNDGLAMASGQFAAGTYPLEFITYNRDGDALAELFAAPGNIGFFDGGVFSLLGTSFSQSQVIRPAGLQLVPEPATVVNAAIGVLLAGVVALRQGRRRSKRRLG